MLIRGQRYRRSARVGAVALAVAVVGLVPGVGSAFAASPAGPLSGGSHFTLLATYHTNLRRSGYTASEKISAAQAAGLHSLWTRAAGAALSGEAAVVNGVAYWGDWKGVEHATAANGTDLWATGLGTTTDRSCNPVTVGVASSATVASVGTTQLLWTGTGNGMVAALNASTGQVVWETRVAPKVGGFVWSSPALYHGDIYIGVASFGDCPLVRGAVVQLDALTGTIVNTFYTAPAGCVGAGVWASPAIDSSTNSVFVTTGNPSCTDTLGTAIVQLNASTLALMGSWQIPAAQNVSDGDWGATPTLFKAKIGGVSTPLVGGAGKNGVFYAFRRSALANGPIWQLQVAQGGDCPQCGQGSISPAAFDGHTLYVAGGQTTIAASQCTGGLRAVDPATGTVKWQNCLAGDVLSPVGATPGLVFVTAGSQILCVAAQTGSQIWSFSDPTGYSFYGGPVVTAGVVYAGNLNGNMYAFTT